jgi:hypothetical protein
VGTITKLTLMDTITKLTLMDTITKLTLMDTITKLTLMDRITLIESKSKDSKTKTLVCVAICTHFLQHMLAFLGRIRLKL